jgi:lysophospholipase L1-like esterase
VRTLLKIAVVFCSFLLAFLALEYGLLRGALRYHGIVEAQVVDHDDELGWKLRPNVEARSSALEYTIAIRTDALGLRASGRTDAWRSASHRLLVAGDSFAFGWGVEGSQMLSARLQDALGARGVQAAVLTSGVPGYSTDQEYLLWRRLEPQVRPEVVILLLSGNDPPADNASTVAMGAAIYSKPVFHVADGGLELRGVPVPDKQSAIVPTAFEPLKARLRPFATYALARRFNTTLRAPRAAEGGPAPAIAIDTLPVTGAILAAFNRELRAQGGKLLLVLIPSPTVRDALSKICKDEGIAFLDLDPVFAGHPDWVFKYDGHWNPRGHQAAADAVVPVVAGMLK